MLGLSRLTIYTSFSTPKGQIDQTKAGNLLMHPLTYMILGNNGRVPLYTRHTLGTREVERDRRKYGKRKGSPTT